jgi:hypothetical protein
MHITYVHLVVLREEINAVHVNVILRGVRVTVVAVEKQ